MGAPSTPTATHVVGAKWIFRCFQGLATPHRPRIRARAARSGDRHDEAGDQQDGGDDPDWTNRRRKDPLEWVTENGHGKRGDHQRRCGDGNHRPPGESRPRLQSDWLFENRNGRNDTRRSSIVKLRQDLVDFAFVLRPHSLPLPYWNGVNGFRRQ